MRRIFFTVPNARHASRIITELEAAGIERSRMHALARTGINLPGLPVATEPQRRDRVSLLENRFWRTDLVVFGIAAVLLALATFNAWTFWAIAALFVMLLSFLLGNWFSVNLPHAHLGDLRVPLAHGEVVLMIDVPRTRVREIEQLVSRHHPEADVSGVSWTIQALGT